MIVFSLWFSHGFVWTLDRIMSAAWGWHIVVKQSSQVKLRVFCMTVRQTIFRKLPSAPLAWLSWSVLTANQGSKTRCKEPMTLWIEDSSARIYCIGLYSTETDFDTWDEQRFHYYTTSLLINAKCPQRTTFTTIFLRNKFWSADKPHGQF